MAQQFYEDMWKALRWQEGLLRLEAVLGPFDHAKLAEDAAASPLPRLDFIAGLQREAGSGTLKVEQGRIFKKDWLEMTGLPKATIDLIRFVDVPEEVKREMAQQALAEIQKERHAENLRQHGRTINTRKGHKLTYLPPRLDPFKFLR